MDDKIEFPNDEVNKNGSLSIGEAVSLLMKNYGITFDEAWAIIFEWIDTPEEEPVQEG